MQLTETSHSTRLDAVIQADLILNFGAVTSYLRILNNSIILRYII